MRTNLLVAAMCCFLLLGCGPAATPVAPAATAVPAPPTGAPSPVSPPTPAPTGTPGPPVLLPLEMSPQELGRRETFQAALGDLDGDGDLDAVFANPMRNPAAVWLNDGSGALTDTGQRLTPYGHGVGLADFDDDGDLDAVIVCHQNVAPTQVYLNDTGSKIQWCQRGSGAPLATGS